MGDMDEGLLGRSRMMRSLAIISETMYVKKEIGEDRLMDVFKKSMETGYDKSSPLLYYDKCFSELDGTDYSIPDIERVCRRIKDYNSDRAGVCLSAAINRIIKDGDKVRLDFNEFKPYDTGLDYLCMFLKSGTVSINGAAGNYLGYAMGGGKVFAHGGARHRPGMGMTGGKIVILGRALLGVGDGSTGGEIFAENIMSEDSTSKAKVAKLSDLGDRERIALMAEEYRKLPETPRRPPKNGSNR